MGLFNRRSRPLTMLEKRAIKLGICPKCHSKQEMWDSEDDCYYCPKCDTFYVLAKETEYQAKIIKNIRIGDKTIKDKEDQQ